MAADSMPPTCCRVWTELLCTALGALDLMTVRSATCSMELGGPAESASSSVFTLASKLSTSLRRAFSCSSSADVRETGLGATDATDAGVNYYVTNDKWGSSNT